MTVFGLTIPFWYMALVGCAVFTSALVLVLAIAARHRADEEQERGDEEPAEVEPDDDFGVDDADAVTQFFAVIRAPLPDDPFAPEVEPEPAEGSDEMWQREWAGLEAQFHGAFDAFEAGLRGSVSGEWLEMITSAEIVVRREHRKFDALRGPTQEYQLVQPAMLELIGAR